MKFSLWNRICWRYYAFKRAFQKRKNDFLRFNALAERERNEIQLRNELYAEIQMWRRRYLKEKGLTKDKFPNTFDVFMSFSSARLREGPDILFENAKNTKLSSYKESDFEFVHHGSL